MSADGVSAAAKARGERSRSRSKGAICFERETDDGKERVRLAQNADPSESDSITASEPDGREYADALPSPPIAGSGERLPDCGDDVRPVFCTECGHPPIVGRTCRRSRCPRCWQSWAFYRARTVASKIAALRRYRAASGNPKAKYHHLTVSFPDSTRFDSDDALSRGFDAVKRLLAEVDVYAGVIVYHPYRIDEPYRGDVRGHESGDGDMTWADVLGKIESDEWTWEAARDEFLTDAPHFHVFANAEFVQGGAVSERVEEQTGVVIHRITKRNKPKYSLESVEDLAAATAYAYSHAGLSQGDDSSFQVAARAFGETANFTPTDEVKRDVDGALREIAPDVLGVDFSKRECREETVDDEHESGESDEPETPASGVPSASPPLSPAGSSGGFATGSGTSLDAPTGPPDDASGGGSENDTWSATAGVSPGYLDEPTEDVTSRCGGRHAPMWAADEYLSDPEWVDSVGREAADELRSAYDEWERRERPESDVPPLDAPDPPDAPPD